MDIGRQFQAIHRPRHFYIRENETDLRIGFEQSDGIVRIACCENSKTCIFNGINRCHKKHWFIFYHHNITACISAIS